ncbi:MCE family protein [Actinomadura soli]|uniref:MCE family protein n=1 Tax=Actinomadura soli TaxID=2508997 RepID=A0A5C4JBD9_9ACTN|nr:MCE family protein [Actinomadura soli]TMR00169.1 MCE family protein [Actinomadura soli]
MSEETQSNRSRTVFGLVGAGVIAAATVFVAVGTTPSHEGSTYYNATFGRAGQGLDPGKSDVKVRGIVVGTVDRITLVDSGRVNVRFRVDKGIKVADTTVAAVEPVSVFGPKDLALDLGAHELTGPYLEDGGKVAKTRDPEDLSDTAWPTYKLTKAINPDEVATILHVFGSGLSGQGPALRRTIGNGATVVNATYESRAAINALLADLNGLSGTFASRGGTLAGLAGDFNRLARTINERPDKITQLLDESGRLGDTLGASLQQHGRNLGTIIDSGGQVVAVLNGQRRNIPVLLDSLNGFFNLLAQVIRIPGPEGTLIAQMRDDLPLDICQILIDICPVKPSTTAFTAPLSRASAGGRR